MSNATATRARVLLVCQSDGYANGVKPDGIEQFLRARGHEVDVINTYYLSRASTDPGSPARKLPRPGLRRLAIYAVEAGSLLLTRRWQTGRRRLSYYAVLADYRLRRSLLSSTIRLEDYDAVICEHPHDAGLLTATTQARTFYDCPNPYADEMYCEGKLTDAQHRRLRDLETGLFESVDGLSFSWESYARYALEHYGISGRNLRQLNWGCHPASERAEFRDPPRVIYLGSLSSRFINLPLLSRLSRLYPHIDVYGGPPPDPSLQINYKGWSPPTVLQKYQLGLITTSEDELRKDGFSAKHLDYIAYGLPVLVPAWRRHLDLLQGSVPYEEDDFLDAISRLSDEREWSRMSDIAYQQARRLTWEQTLRPLEDWLRERPTTGEPVSS